MATARMGRSVSTGDMSDCVKRHITRTKRKRKAVRLLVFPPCGKYETAAVYVLDPQNDPLTTK